MSGKDLGDPGALASARPWNVWAIVLGLIAYGAANTAQFTVGPYLVWVAYFMWGIVGLQSVVVLHFLLLYLVPGVIVGWLVRTKPFEHVAIVVTVMAVLSLLARYRLAGTTNSPPFLHRGWMIEIGAGITLCLLGVWLGGRIRRRSHADAGTRKRLGAAR